ncbi:unnamed protein product [Thlaspi arvense]|uniref:F-box domain-containing protein n=1 Tax=Thlaspi arvense TaxID=13288 RepID=A0AAU9RTI7_THLAR|nr:unnamed protein product [Thlaspi arvense]
MRSYPQTHLISSFEILHISLTTVSMSAQPDMISNLPDELLVQIVSCLPFKECVRTSVLSKRWRYQYRETTNLGFKESDFVSPSLQDPDRIDARQRFVDFVFQWVGRVQNRVVESFELCLSSPRAYLAQVEALIAFAVRKQVKKLVLDFSSPTWRISPSVPDHEVFVVVPESVYNLTSLESLTVSGCRGFDTKRFADPGIFKSLSFGWMRLLDVEYLLSKAYRLVSLNINNCWELDIVGMEGNLREVSIQNCKFPDVSLSFDLPRVDIFKYSGDIIYLRFNRMNTIIKEVHLDFQMLIKEYEDPNDPNTLCDHLYGLRSAMTLTVCPYLLRVIQQPIYQMHLLQPLTTQHLVLKTRLHPKEFNGIMILLSNCPDLETLTLDMLPPTSFSTDPTYPGIDHKTYWMQNMTCICLMKTLKVVVVRNFVRGRNDLNVLKYLIRYGTVLERVELYLPYGVDEDKKKFANEGAEMLQRSSKHVHVPCAQFLKR